MANDVIVMDAELRQVARLLDDGGQELKAVLEEYQNVLQYINENAIVEEKISSKLNEKSNRLNGAIKRLVPCIEEGYRAIMDYLEEVANLDEGV